jgi:undecaprenyl-diphosphatase
VDKPERVAKNRRLFGLIIVATIPGVVVGFLLEHFFRNLFGNPSVAAVFLMVNGVLLLGGERLRAQSGWRSLASLTARDAFAFGCWRCTTLIPGISRPGATMVGGLLRGINHEDAAHFSFLIATPIIVGATVLEVPKLLRAGVLHGVLADTVLAAVVAGVTAFVSTAFLMRYFRDHDRRALNPLETASW